MYERVKREKKDAQFEHILRELVESTHMARDGDLPDHMRSGFSAKAWFE